MQEEIQRASMQSQMDSLAVELEDDFALVQSIECGFEELASQLRRIHKGIAKLYEVDEPEVPSNLQETIYFSLVHAVVNFAKSIKGFQLLDRKDCIHLLKNAIFQVLLLRWTSLKLEVSVTGSSISYLEAPTIAKYVVMSRETSNSYSPTLQASITEFIQRFRLLGLDDRQTSIFAALILCQPDSVGGGIGTSTSHNHQARLLKMLQEKLSIALQSVLFPHPPLNALTGPLLNQSLYAAFADLKSLNSLHQQHLQCFRTIPNQCSPSSSEVSEKLVIEKGSDGQKRRRSTAFGSFHQQHGLLATLAAVAASREFVGMNEVVRPTAHTQIKASSQKRRDGKFAVQVVDSMHSPSVEARHQHNLVVGEMPNLRRCLEEPPMLLQSAALAKKGRSLSLIEKHKEVASLLDRPANLLYFSTSEHQQKVIDEFHQHQDEEPLNLCTREMK